MNDEREGVSIPLSEGFSDGKVVLVHFTLLTRSSPFVVRVFVSKGADLKMSGW